MKHLIRIIQNKDIDSLLWDRCVARAKNGDVFAYHWYLDAVYAKWYGIVLGNYKAVMPLPLKHFLSFKYSKNNIFSHNTNIAYPDELPQEIINTFCLLAKQQAKRVSLYTENKSISLKSSKIDTYYSWKLDLIRPYKDVKNGYKDEMKTQLLNGMSFNEGITPNGIALLASITGTFTKYEINTLRRLSAITLRKRLGQIYGAFNKNNQLIAAVLFVASHYKVHIVAPILTKEARKEQALYGLIDHYIKQHSEKALTLDFCGIKDLPESFFDNFSAVKYPRYRIKL